MVDLKCATYRSNGERAGEAHGVNAAHSVAYN